MTLKVGINMLDLSYLGSWIHVQSYKHDKTLHRTWDTAMIVDVNDDYIVIVSNCTKVIESDGRRWFTREPAVSIFFFKEWYNVIAMFKENAIMYYCNIASPSLIDKDCIKYIDYDLDLKLMPDKNIIQLDNKEYEYHRKKFAYSNDLDIVVKHANEKCKKLMEEGKFPFDDKINEKYYNKFVELKDSQEKNIILERKD